MPLAVAVWCVLCLIWSSTWLFIKLGLADLPPLSFAGIRFVVAASVLWGIIAIRRSPLPKGLRAWGFLAVTGFLAFSLNYGLLFWGEQRTSSGLAAVLQATIPAFGLAIAHLLLPADRMTVPKVLGVSLGIAGVANEPAHAHARVEPLRPVGQEQARRALENERVTVVAHETGYIHTIYETATIGPEAYDHFAKRLRHYLRTPLTVEILGNFIRQSPEVQPCFQLRWQCCGADAYVPLEKVFAYERDSPYLVTDNTRDKLMQDIDQEVCEPQLLPDRIVLNDLEAFARDNRINLDKPRDVEALKEKFACGCLNAKTAIDSLIRFCHLEPRLPDAASRKFASDAEAALGIEAGMGRDGIIQHLETLNDAVGRVSFPVYALREKPSWVRSVHAALLHDVAAIGPVGQHWQQQEHGDQLGNEFSHGVLSSGVCYEGTRDGGRSGALFSGQCFA